MSTDAPERAREAATWSGRAGLTSRGVLYCVAGILGTRLATGDHEQVDKDGAIAAVARQPLGRGLVLVLAAGFAGYALWRLTRAATGAREGGSSREGASGAAKRLADVGRALLYVALCGTALRFAFGSSESGSGEQEREWTAELLERSWGRPLVALAGAVVLGGGAVFAYRGLREKFTDKLRLGEMNELQRRWLPRVGTIGYVARGVVFALIGWFVLQAAVEFDADEAVGVDGALKRLLDEAYGPYLVGLLAAGLLCFGLFCFAEMRWRKVLED